MSGDGNAQVPDEEEGFMALPGANKLVLLEARLKALRRGNVRDGNAPTSEVGGVTDPFLWEAMQWLRSGIPLATRGEDKKVDLHSPGVVFPQLSCTEVDTTCWLAPAALKPVPLKYLLCAPGPGKEWRAVNSDVLGLLPTEKLGWQSLLGGGTYSCGAATEGLVAMAEAAFYAEQVERKLLQIPLAAAGEPDYWQFGGRLDPAAKNFIVNGDHWALYRIRTGK